MRPITVPLGALLALLVVATVPGVEIPLRAVLAALLVVAAAGAVADRRDPFDVVGAVLGVALAGFLLAIVFDVLSSDALGADAGHLLAWGVAIALVASVGIASRDPPFVLAFSLLAVVIAHHASAIPASSGLFRYVVTGMVAMGFFLFVLPRHLPREGFYWTVAATGAALVAVGLPIYVVDPFSVGGVTVRGWSTSVRVLGVRTGIPVLRSVFANPNTLGVVTFAGTIAAVAAAHRAVPSGLRADRPLGGPPATRDLVRDAVTTPAVLAAGALFVVNAVGLLLTNSRASHLAAAVALVLFTVAVLVGRRALAPTAAVLVVGVLAGIAGMAVGAVPISASGRFELWSGALQATADGSWLVGNGLGAPSEFIAPYVEEPWSGHSTHNSYLSIMIRFGAVGVFGYAVLVLGAIFSGSIRADVGSVAFAMAVGVNQLFEAYTMLGFGALAAVTALAVGYALTPDSARAGARPAEREHAGMAPL